VISLAKENTNKIETVEEKVTFSKTKILKSKRYRFRVDLLNVLLNDSKEYTFDEVDALIKKFMKGKVK